MHLLSLSQLPLLTDVEKDEKIDLPVYSTRRDPFFSALL